MRVRPCFLVVDQEHAGSISSRKLVLETAKFNVITAYSIAEALATLQMFPNVHGVVMNGATREAGCAEFFQTVSARHPHTKRVLVGSCHAAVCPYDYFVESFSPATLLKTLQRAFPEESEQLQQIEDNLERQKL